MESDLLDARFYSLILRSAVNDGDNMDYLLLYLKDDTIVTHTKGPATFKSVP